MYFVSVFNNDIQNIVETRGEGINFPILMCVCMYVCMYVCRYVCANNKIIIVAIIKL